jgi:hypothetical protein
VFLGGKASGFRNLRDHDTYDVDGTRLFQVSVTGLLSIHLVQVSVRIRVSLCTDISIRYFP